MVGQGGLGDLTEVSVSCFCVCCVLISGNGKETAVSGRAKQQIKSDLKNSNLSIFIMGKNGRLKTKVQVKPNSCFQNTLERSHIVHDQTLGLLGTPCAVLQNLALNMYHTRYLFTIYCQIKFTDNAQNNCLATTVSLAAGLINMKEKKNRIELIS